MLTQLDQASKVYVAGHRGMVGSAVCRALTRRGVSSFGLSSDELDLRVRADVMEFFEQQRPTHVVFAAARVGGIWANMTEPANFISDNLLVQVNVLDAAQQVGTPRLLFLGSSCVYPKLAPQPINEDALLSGPLEPTNDAYAIAKIAGLIHVQALRRQFGLPYISAMPTNLYGPGDNFHPKNAHVLPALLRRMHDAKVRGMGEVTLWGSGSPRREFMHVDDLAEACVFLLEHYDDDVPINIGIGGDMSIKELAEAVQRAVGFEGELHWDATKPDGTPRKLLDVTRLRELGWQPSRDFDKGLAETYAWFEANLESGTVRL